MLKTRQALVVACALLAMAPAWAAGPKRPKAPRPMKRVVWLDSIPDRYIELPDPADPFRSYGRNIETRLIEELQRTRDVAIVLGSGEHAGQVSSALSAAQAGPGSERPDPCLLASSPAPSVRVAIGVAELSFVTGSRAERLRYGFTREYQNPYNAGVSEEFRNEFPPKLKADETGEPGWFGREFADTGGLHDGKELGHEINFDVLLLGASLKHQHYSATLGLDLEVRDHSGQVTRRELLARGEGFYFDLSAFFTYYGGQYSGGLGLARKAALLDAFGRAVAEAVRAVADELQRKPLVARLAGYCAGAPFLGVGADFRVPVGQRFYNRAQLEAGQAPAIFTVAEVFQRSARLSVQGSGFAPGDELVSLAPGESPPRPQALGLASSALASTSVPERQELMLVPANLDPVPSLSSFIESFFKRLWEGIKALLTLPYRIARYFQYDQGYGGGELTRLSPSNARTLAGRLGAMRAIGLAEALSSCAEGQNCLGAREVIVAVIDSGIDYNHRELRRNIFWDGAQDTPGMDFISGDSRPYDDHAHGTRVASLIAGGGGEVLGVAPEVTLMPVKAFSPYGITSSAALYAAFEYAIAKGARIIVAAWATPKPSRALEDAIGVARANGVLVVAAAGDLGENLDHRPHFPAAWAAQYDNVLAVAAQGEDGGLLRAQVAVTNFGQVVQLAAPGSALKVAEPRNQYARRSGSSLAAGLVAGAAALVWSRCPKATVLEVKTALLEGAARNPALRSEIAENRQLSLPGALERMAVVCK